MGQISIVRMAVAAEGALKNENHVDGSFFPYYCMEARLIVVSTVNHTTPCAVTPLR